MMNMPMISCWSTGLVKVARLLVFGVVMLAACSDKTAEEPVPEPDENTSIPALPDQDALPSHAVSPSNMEYLKSYHDQSAFMSGVHRNLFVEMGLASAAGVQEKIRADYQQLFFGDPDNQALLYDAGNGMAYIHAVDNNDIRSEGMSYGMMIAVMMDDMPTFNRLWKFAKTYMEVKEGDLAGYFAWQLNSKPPFTPIDPLPATDGEEYFVMALFFAHARWGSGEGIFNYRAQANAILDVMINKDTETVRPMMNREHKQIVFSPGARAVEHTDPSYHLPAFYELWALWADRDNEYWRTVAEISRNYFVITAHQTTGLFPEYSTFEGEPLQTDHNPNSHHSGPDAWRVIQNMAMDYDWFSKDIRLKNLVERLHRFYHQQGLPGRPRQYVGSYRLDGSPLVDYRPEGLVAMNAVGALASGERELARGFVGDLWNQPVPSGKYRYYNGLLHMLGILHVSGNFRIYGNPYMQE